MDNRRDVCIGETTLSAEILLRPPAEPWEGHLGQPERSGIHCHVRCETRSLNCLFSSGLHQRNINLYWTDQLK